MMEIICDRHQQPLHRCLTEQDSQQCVAIYYNPDDPWCDTHSRPLERCYDENYAKTRKDVAPDTHKYKVVIRDTAADMLLTDFGMFSDILKYNRASPIVMYVDITDTEAVMMAQESGFEVTRARADWSI
jgi:hypothetical protein